MKPSIQRAILSAVAVGAALAASVSIDPKTYLSDVQFLASKQMRGRATGSPELEKAAEFLAARYREFGLQPVAGSFFQRFPVTLAGKVGADSRFAFVDRGAGHSLRLRQDFQVFSFSSSLHRKAGVVFAGYGITAPEYKYDDYAGIDVKGKIVIVLRHEPQELDEHSVFAGRELTAHARFTSKASNAKMHGAAAVVLVNDRAHHTGDPDELDKRAGEDGPNDVGIGFVQATESAVDGWFREAGKPLEELEADIDRDLKPRSFAWPAWLTMDLDLDVRRETKTVRNVLAYLPGETSEYVVIGAHYDHLGLGEQFSLAPSLAGAVHPGADDNASGTAGTIELARWFSRQPKQKRGILFLNFAGEELGLLGSQWYTEHPELPLADAVAMLNLDMIGRERNGKVYVGGAASGTTLRALLDRLAPAERAHIDYSQIAGSDGSDHTSFLAKQVPALFFFSGLHEDYHKPSDTSDKINAQGAADILALVAHVAEALREDPARPQFVRAAAGHGSPHGAGDSGPVSSSIGGYGPYFGSVPDFGEGVEGVKFADVREGSPAARAGFRGGDVLVEFDGKRIQNLYDFTYALQSKKPGDTVRVKVLRGGQPVEADVLLTVRP